MGLESKVKETISIQDYYKLYIDSKIDLVDNPKICCPFHQESTPSFTFSLEKGLWRCWGSCKTGGDVIALHKSNYRLKSRKEAVTSLARLIGIDELDVDFTPPVFKVNQALVSYKLVYNQAIQLAKTVDDFIELDFIMSQHKAYNELQTDLEMYVNKRRSP